MDTLKLSRNQANSGYVNWLEIKNQFWANHSTFYIMTVFGNEHNQAIAYAIAGSLSFAVLQIVFKESTGVLSSFQLLYIRSIFLFFITAWLINRRGLTAYIPSSQTFRMILVRIVLVGGGQTIVYYCLTYLPVSTVITLLNLGPVFIFFVQSIAYRRALNTVSLILSVVSFIGVIFILQPEFIFGSHDKEVPYFEFYVVLMLISALMSAFNFHYIHDLSKFIHPLVNMIFSHLGFIAISTILTNFQPFRAKAEDFTITYLFQLALIVISGFGAQYCLFMANSMIKPSKAMPLGYISVIVGFLADVYLFDTTFTILPVIGMFLTSAGLLTDIILSKTKQPLELDPDDPRNNEASSQDKQDVEGGYRDSRV